MTVHYAKLIGHLKLILHIEYVSRYATKEAADAATDDDSESDDEMSSVGSFDSGDEEPAGTMEEV